ncbi:chemotaxis protein CheW [Clostridium sp. SM-530-WT-3G]|uniref:chemotaxis protein CheW n=1 Tax=Clostridium sp. SM-530-WT-3G TaxID=2725303 RepID=UPI00145C7E17|nr:chemotaxis protein CheW [Clostridium sp. SM-530-WT-3G]NME82813.1 purine-binding chemotaxis protein CheW [Clostridium sp. SM-530-WT-3G]
MADNDNKILVFGLSNEKYSTNITEVERILGYVEPTILPETPDFVRGVIDYEDSILPIISLSNKFKLGEDKITEATKIIVVKRKEKKFGVIVDNVYEVTDINNKNIAEMPEITNAIERKYISGLIKLDNHIVILLDLDRVLSSEDEASIF